MESCKVIDLFQRIAKREEVPNKIRYKGIVFTYIWTNRKALKYVNEEYEDGDNARRHLFWYVDSFDDEVEVIEEEQETGEIEILTFDNMKDFGIKAGKAYRNFFEGFNKGWNMPIEEKKK